MAAIRRIPHIVVAEKTVAANQTDSVTVSIGGDDLEIYGIAGYATSDRYNLQIVPSDTGKNLQSALVDSQCVVGTAKEIGRIDGGGAGYGQPLRVAGGSQITINLKDKSGSSNAISLALYCFRLVR